MQNVSEPGRETEEVYKSLPPPNQSSLPFLDLNFIEDVLALSSELADNLSEQQFEMAHQKENQILKHYFENLVLKVDANKQSPWENLILKYCNFSVARSCFITLASMHLYQEEGQKKQELYQMSKKFLEKIKSEVIGLTTAVGFPNNENECKTVLVLIYVYLLHCILDDGISKDCQFYFQTFADICKNHIFAQTLRCDDQMKVLVATLSWYDIVATLLSSECRPLACDPSWFGERDSKVLTIKIMGCPGEIFQVLAELCRLKSTNGNSPEFLELRAKNSKTEMLELIPKINNYRNYIATTDESELSVVIKCSQCWAITAHLAILRELIEIDQNPDENSNLIQILVREFLDVFSTLDLRNRTVGQLVYPMFLIGCECKERDRKVWLHLYSGLYAAAHSGALQTLKKAVELIWEGKPGRWDGDRLLL